MVKIHSTVDIITKSSTVIYTSATKETLSTVKKLIDNIIKMSSRVLCVDDLFEIELVPNLDEDDLRQARIDKYYDTLYEESDCNLDEDELYDKLCENPPEWWDDLKILCGSAWNERYASKLKITPKTNVEEFNDIASLIEEALQTIESEEFQC